MTTNIVALRVGKIEVLKNSDKEVFSAINKINTNSSYLTNIGFEDDEQFDKKHHGGENKDVLLKKLTKVSNGTI